MPISFLYPFIELLTAITMSMLLSLIDMHYFFAYFIFFSALIITIRTDLETMMISRFMTLFLVPFGILCSMLGLLPISPVESIIGALLGYSILYCIAFLFYRRTGKEGIGQGDLDLLSFIGSCTGIYGCWISLLIGSVLGSLVGIIYILISKANKKNIKIPFGPFLSLGAICFVLYQHQLLKSILRI
jgi:leader peptidase (prepilin peptidase)/N-methyltransferase